MRSSSTNWSPVGFETDPTPGSAEAADSLASELLADAEELWHHSEVMTRVLGSIAPPQWSGKAAEAFAERLRAVIEAAKTACTQHSEAAGIWRGWAGELSEAQTAADSALRAAEDALEDIATAEASLGLLTTEHAGLVAALTALEKPVSAGTSAASDVPGLAAARRRAREAEDDLAGVGRRMKDAQQRLEEAKTKAAAAKEQYDLAESASVARLETTLTGAMPSMSRPQLDDFVSQFSSAAWMRPASTKSGSGKGAHTPKGLLDDLEKQYRKGSSATDWKKWAKKHGYTPDEVLALFKKMTPKQRKKLNGMLAAPSEIRVGFTSWLLTGLPKRKDVTWLHDHLPALEPGIPGGAHWKQWVDIDVTGPFSPGDINQGGVNDCWWLADLAAYANTEAGQKWLREHIRDNGNGTYTVTLYQDGKPVQVTVTDYFPAGTDSNGEDYPYGARDDRDDHEANWVSIFEKARASMPDTGSYDAVNGAFSVLNEDFGAGGAMATLTGDKASWFSPHTGRVSEYGGSELRRDLAEGRPVTLTTAFAGPDGMVPWHVYTVTGVDSEGKFILRNPWGPTPETAEYLHMTYAELAGAGWYLNIGVPPK